MDYRLIQRRNASRLAGVECWLVAIFEPGGSTPVLALTNYYEDLTYDGVEYTHYNLQVNEPPDAEVEGLPVGRLTISNVTRDLQQVMSASNYYRGGRCEFIAYNTEEPDVDYTGLVRTLQIVSHQTTLRSISLQLAVPKELIEQIPEDLYGPFSCRHRFQTPDAPSSRCGYVGEDVDDVTLSGTDPVSIEATGHGLSTGDLVQLDSIAGITPSLDGVYYATVTDVDNFTLDDTDSSDYSGAYTSGGTAGFAWCQKNRTACRVRGRTASFGGEPGIRPDGIVVGA
jgi:hypothetical protein